MPSKFKNFLFSIFFPNSFKSTFIKNIFGVKIQITHILWFRYLNFRAKNEAETKTSIFNKKCFGFFFKNLNFPFCVIFSAKIQISEYVLFEFSRQKYLKNHKNEMRKNLNFDANEFSMKFFSRYLFLARKLKNYQFFLRNPDNF